MTAVITYTGSVFHTDMLLKFEFVMMSSTFHDSRVFIWLEILKRKRKGMEESHDPQTIFKILLV